MRVYTERGGNFVEFEFTAFKFENKVKNFLQYSKRFSNKFFKRKEKISGVYIDYTFGYKTKEPELYYTRHSFPPDMKITQSEILKFAISDMEAKHDIFIDQSDPERQQIYYLRSITIHFLYT